MRCRPRIARRARYRTAARPRTHRAKVVVRPGNSARGFDVRCLCRNDCDPRLLLCARLCASGRSLRRAPSWPRLRIRPRYPAIRAASTRAAIRFTSRRVSPWGISHASIRPTSSRPIWCTSRRVLIAPKHLPCRTALGRGSSKSVDAESEFFGTTPAMQICFGLRLDQIINLKVGDGFYGCLVA